MKVMRNDTKSRMRTKHVYKRGQRMLSMDEARQIRKLRFEQRLKYKDLARLFQTSSHVIYQIVKGISYKEVKKDEES